MWRSSIIIDKRSFTIAFVDVLQLLLFILVEPDLF